MELAELTASYPRLWHATFPGAWPSIWARGLLPAADLLARAGDPNAARRFRPEISPLPGGEVLRDQLTTRRDPTPYLDGVTAEDWWALVNTRVYLFCREAPLKKLLDSYARRGYAQEVVSFRTAALLGSVEDRVELAIVNAGVFPRRAGPCRGRGTFVPLGRFDSAQVTHVKEVTVTGGVEVDQAAVFSVVHHDPDGTARRLWP